VKIILTGDIHGRFGYLNNLINKENPDMVICTGDFGYWPNIPYLEKLSNINSEKTKILWIDGNHEDHWAIREIQSYTLKTRVPVQTVKNIFYIPRGTVYELEDKRKVLFMGGGLSIDKHLRQEGVDWFPEETISYGDMQNLPDEKIDIIISHTGPTEFVNTLKQFYGEKFYDPSEEALSQLLKTYNPNLWYFSHFHTFKTGFYNNTRWYCLDMAPKDNWWIQLQNEEGN
jgi:predicted phosphodiesterase